MKNIVIYISERLKLSNKKVIFVNSSETREKLLKIFHSTWVSKPTYQYSDSDFDDICDEIVMILKEAEYFKTTNIYKYLQSMGLCFCLDTTKTVWKKWKQSLEENFKDLTAYKINKFIQDNDKLITKYIIQLLKERE